MATSTVTVVVCDIVASTARHARLGDDAADTFRGRFFREVRACVEAASGEVIKNLGDGFLIIFRRSTVDALKCALAIHETVAGLDEDDPVAMRIGISAGEVAEEQGDVFGMPVIEASRLCAAASPGVTLTNTVVRGLAGSRGGYTFVSAGRRELKGMPGPIETWRVTTAPPGSTQQVAAAQPSLHRSRPRLPILIGAGALVVTAIIVLELGRRDDGGPATVDSTTPATTQPAVSTASSGPATSTAATSRAIPEPANYVPTLTDRDCASDPFATGHPDVTCFSLTVPENRAKPGRTIELHGYRIASTAQSPDTPTLIDLGPEGGFDNPLRDVAEIVLLPARGYGLTEPAMDCPEMKRVGADGLLLPSGDPGVAARLLDAVQACHDRLTSIGVDIASYNYESEVGDLTDYVWAAKLRSVFITGASDDAPALLVAADRFPDSFAGVILDNPRDPGSGWREDPVKDLTGALDRYIALCNANPACAARYPSLQADVSEQFARLTANPVPLDGTGDGFAARNIRLLGSEPHSLLLDGPRGVRLLQYVLRGASLPYNVLAAALADPNATYARSAVGTIIGVELGDATGVRDAAELSFRCSSIAEADSTAAASAELFPLFAGVYDPSWADQCKIWNVPQVSREFVSASTGAVPTFIGVGELAPSPSTEWADALDRSRPNVTVARFATLGNFLDFTAPPCYQNLLRSFILDPTSPIDVAPCEAASPPIDFVIS